VDQQKPSGPPNSANKPEGELAQNPAVDEFFTRLRNDMRHPKPGQEGIAAALQAIQRLSLEVDAEESASAGESTGGSQVCLVCGGQNRPQHRYCATCGTPLEAPPAAETPVLPETALTALPGPSVPLPPGPHHYHHHYHHHYFSGDGMAQGAVDLRPPATGQVREARRAPTAGASLSRAESAVRQLTQDLALACNNKQLDDLVDLYGADALVLRPNFPAVRGSAAIREFFFSALDAGLGEVEMQPLRVEIFGDVAYEAGRCKMLLPVAMGKRREERGKYLIISARQGGGDWKAMADCWSSDLSLGVSGDSGGGKTQSSPNPLSRPSRKMP
jgi:ketosteroid isomerase-like protein